MFCIFLKILGYDHFIYEKIRFACLLYFKKARYNTSPSLSQPLFLAQWPLYKIGYFSYLNKSVKIWDYGIL